MNKQNLLTITLIVTGLALNPVMAESEYYLTTQNQNFNQSITSRIANILHHRGLDEDAAEVMAENLLDEEDEMLLALLMQNLEMQNIVTKNEVLEYLSDAALYKQKLDLKSYDQLIGMVAKIKQKPLDQSTLTQLRHIAKQNTFMFA